MKRHSSGHYCIVCGKWKANERFSGSGYVRHICKECAGLPPEIRDQKITVNRIMQLPQHLSKNHIQWLKTMEKDQDKNIRSAAEAALQAISGQILNDDPSDPDEDEFPF